MRATGGNITHEPRLAQLTFASKLFAFRLFSILEYTYQVSNLHAHSGAQMELPFLKSLFMFSGESKPSRNKVCY